MTRRERIALIGCAVVATYAAVRVTELIVAHNKMFDKVNGLLEREYQEVVDEVFEGIVEDYGDRFDI